MVALLITLHVLVSIFLIFVILLQPGKGDGMGSAFGGGGSGTVFGSRGSVTFLAKVTEVCAVIFMVTSLVLAYRSSHSASVVAARRNIQLQDQKQKEDAAKKTDATPTPAPNQSAPAPAGSAAPVQNTPPAAPTDKGSNPASPASPAAPK